MDHFLAYFFDKIFYIHLFYLCFLSSIFFYSHPASALLLSDEDEELAYVKHIESTAIECCSCARDGWNKHELLVHKEDRNIMTNECGHHVCIKCLYLTVLKAEEPKCPCPFEICNFKISNKLLDIFKQQKGYKVECTSCSCVNFIEDFSSWSCVGCHRVACGLCDEETCQCFNNPPRRFSRFFFKDGMPIREHLVTKEQRKARKKIFDNLAENFYLLGDKPFSFSSSS